MPNENKKSSLFLDEVNSSYKPGPGSWKVRSLIPGWRFCTVCQKELEESRFGKDSSRPDGLHVTCKECRSTQQRTARANLSKTKRGSLKEKRRVYNQNLRMECLQALGGSCACCGETTPEFLSFDHIHGGGTQHRKETGAGSGFYVWLRKAGFPKDLIRVLCHNCNQARGYYGQCPHKIVSQDVLTPTGKR